jgi:O-antigen/teichoic acid export membrane protein
MGALAARTIANARAELRFVASGLLIAGGVVSASGLGFLFSAYVARQLASEGFGEVRFFLALSVIALVPVEHVPTATARFISRSTDPEVRTVLSAGLAAVAMLSPLAVGIAVTISAISRTVEPSLLVVVLGLITLRTYVGLLRGMDRPSRLAAFQVASAAVQFGLVFVAMEVGTWHSVRSVLLAYGIAPILTLAAFELGKPLLLSAGLMFPRLSSVKPILIFYGPLGLGQVFYAIWSGLDIIVLTHFSGSAPTGRYAAAKIVAQLLALVPGGLSLAILPKVAMSRKEGHLRYLFASLSVVTAASVVAGVGLGLARHLLIDLVYSSDFAEAATVLPLLLAGYAAFAYEIAMEGYSVGAGRPWAFTASMGAALVVGMIGYLTLIPAFGPMGAATAFLASAAAGSATMLLATVVLPSQAVQSWRRSRLNQV